jgi:hypothetical protein
MLNLLMNDSLASPFIHFGQNKKSAPSQGPKPLTDRILCLLTSWDFFKPRWPSNRSDAYQTSGRLKRNLSSSYHHAMESVKKRAKVAAIRRLVSKFESGSQRH